MSQTGLPNTLVIFDPTCEAMDVLQQGLKCPQVEVMEISSVTSPAALLAQLATALRDRPHLKTLHLISHGGAGYLQWGQIRLTAADLAKSASWGRSGVTLAPALTLVLYGCEVALGTVGQQFVNLWHRLTGAAVVASTTPTGATALGGNWNFEVAIGHPTWSLPFTDAALATYPGVLAAPVWKDTATTTRAVEEDTSLSLTGITLKDDDHAPPTTPAIQTVTLTATDGTITLASLVGITITGGANGSSTVTFTGDVDAVNGAIAGMTYSPNSNASGTETLSLSANDGTTTANLVVPVAITPINDDSTISPNAAIVNEGGSVSFNASNFNVVDIDNVPAQIILKLTSLPTKGSLRHNGAPVVLGSTFSYDTVNQLVYIHDGTQTTTPGGTSDSFTVLVDDGAGSQVPGTIPITIAAVNQAPSIGGGEVVFEGETDHPVALSLVDPDQTTSFSVQILSLPTDGILKVNGTAAVIGQVLTGAALAAITYSHDGNDDNSGFPPNDSFNIRITDDGGGTGVPITVDATVPIKIIPNNDDPTLPVNTGATLNSSTGRIVTLTPALLQAVDPDSSDAQLTFTLTQLPTQGVLVRDGKQLVVGSSFTQADLNAGKVTYRFSGNAGAGTTDSFLFTVRDGELRNWPTPPLREGGIYPNSTSTTLSQIPFNLTIESSTPTGPGIGGEGLPADVPSNPPTGSITGGPGITNQGIQAVEGGPVVTISSTALTVTDSDNTPDQVIYRLVGLPTGGTLLLNGKALGLYDSFSQADINSNKLTFQHNGEEVFNDTFQFTLSDGTNTVTDNGNPFVFKIDSTPVNDSPTATVKANPFVQEGSTVAIKDNFLTLSDVDGTGQIPTTPPSPNFAFTNTLTFKVSDLPDYGKLQLNGVDITPSTIISQSDVLNGKFTYTHGGDEQFVDAFKLIASDNTDSLGATNHLSNEVTVTIDIAKLNDDPSLQAKQNLKVAEGESGIIYGSTHSPTDGYLVYQDPDNTTLQRQYRITNSVDHGFLLRNGKVLGVGSVFTQKDLDEGLISYQHDGTENFLDEFAFEVRDGGGAVVPGTYQITIDPPVNDAPELTVPGTQTFDTAAPLVFSTGNGNAIAIADEDLLQVDAGEQDFIRVTLDLQEAPNTTYTGSTLTLASTTGLTITGSNGVPGGKVTVEGTLANVKAALNGLSLQVPNDEDRTLKLVVTVDDRINPANPALKNNGGRDPVGATPGYNIITKTIDINASNTNDPPSITAPATATVKEDDTLAFTGVNLITISDADDFGKPMQVTLSVAAGTGKLSATGATGNGTNSITLTGTETELNAALASLKYDKPVNHYNGSALLTITVNDQGNTGAGGSQTQTQTVPITVIPYNDQPGLTVPGLQVIQDNNPLVLGANKIKISDVDLTHGTDYADIDKFTVTLKATLSGAGTAFGDLSFTASGAATLTGNNTDTVTIQGTLADVNATLNSFIYTPDNTNIDESVKITVTVNDGYNGAEGRTSDKGASNIRTSSFLINISGVNEPPVLTPPTNPLVVNEDSSLTLTGSGNLFTFADPDDFGAKNLQVTVTVQNGNLSLVSNDGATVTGSGTSSLTLTGTETQLNNALDGLIFTPTADFHGTADLTVTVNDKGNTGTGGEQTASATRTITVNPVNDRPLASGTIVLPAGTEDLTPASADTFATLVAANGNYTDVTDDQTSKTNGGNTATPFSYVAIVGSTNYVTGQGAWQVSDGSGGWITVPTSGLSETAALVFPSDRAVRFVPAADFHGTPGSLNLRLADNSTPGLSTSTTAADRKNLSTTGGTSATGAWSANTVPLSTTGITPVNDAPRALNPATPVTLASIAEGNLTPPGDLASNLFGSRYNDDTDDQTSITGGGNTKTPLAGIAIIANAANPTTEGKWQYDNGSGWVDVPTVGLSTSAALVLPATAKLRFVPVDDNYFGTPGQLTVHLSDGNGFVSGIGQNISAQINTPGGWSADALNLQTAVTSLNDPPVAVNDTNSIVEDAIAPATGDLRSNDSDVETPTASLVISQIQGSNTITDPAADVTGNYGSLNWDTDGSYSYTLDNGNPAVQALGAGESLTDTFTYTVKDGDGGSATATLTITISGQNDAPVVNIPLGNQANQDSQPINVDIRPGFKDVDASDTLTYSATGLPPGLALDPTTGIISGTLTNNASQGGTSGVYTVTVTAQDKDNATVSQTFTWTVTNPVPVAQDNTGAVSEDGPLSESGNLLTDDDGFGVDTDPDGDPLSVVEIQAGVTSETDPTKDVAGQYGSLNWDTDGSYSYTLDNGNPLVQALGAGESLTDTFTYTVKDGDGGSATATLTITISGQNDGPQLDLDLTTLGTGYVTTYTTGGVNIASPTVQVTDLDSPTLATATVRLINRPNGNNEQLVLTGALPPGLTSGGYDPTTGTLILTGNVPLSSYQTAIALIRYVNTSANPDRQERILEVTVNDGQASSAIALTRIQYPASDYTPNPDGTDGNDIVTGVDPNSPNISGLSDPDLFYGYGGNDIINGGSDFDWADGGEGNDVLNGGSGPDILLGQAGNDVMNGGDGDDFLDGGPGNDLLAGSSGDDLLVGGDGNDSLNGGRGNDLLVGGSGADTLTGGQGRDRFLYKALTEGIDTIVDFEIVHDVIVFSGIPGLNFSTLQRQQTGLDTTLSVNFNGSVLPLAVLKDVNANTLTERHFVFEETPTMSTTPNVSGLSVLPAISLEQADDYLASHPDLIQAFGYDLAAAQAHYTQHGAMEGRAIDTFAEDQYLASHPDLIMAFGYDLTAATRHYIQHGFKEGRARDRFPETHYLNAYPDLKAAFGSDTTAATQHYIKFGYLEGRDPLLGFDGAAYIASYTDLITGIGYQPELGRQHYLDFGLAEGRTITFPGDDYIASNPDLIVAFRSNISAGIEHYIRTGMKEGRAIDTFDEAAYLAKYSDLQAAFGTNTAAATLHYISMGFFEGRTV